MRGYCVFPDCGRERRWLGLCASHAWQREHGVTLRPIGPAPLATRLWAKVNRGDGCWEWRGWKDDKGYGYIQDGDRRRFTHRVSWELTNGPIAAGMFVCHHCDNPPCCRPDHLFLGTAQDNQTDMRIKGRSTRGERNARAKLTTADVVEIRRLLMAGLRNCDVAERFNIARSVITNISKRKSWRHVA
jgi:hypothetical protein